MILLTDLDLYCCDATTTIADVIARINVCPYLFQLIVDKNGLLLGTMTDGDIRRALLRRVDINSPVQSAMNATAFTGVIGQDDENKRKLLKRRGMIRFLPLLDDTGAVREVLVNTQAGIGSQLQPTALIMAGGFGKRLGERTRNRPKPLLEVGGRPILGHILDRLESCGISRIFISVHYLAGQIEAFVNDYAGRAQISLLYEDAPLGTAGAISLLPDNNFSALMVLNGDVLTSLDFRSFVDFHEVQVNAATIAIAQYQSTIPFGVIRYSDSAQFTGIDEKPQHNCFISAGINIVSPDICRLLPRDQALDMPDLLQMGLDAGLPIGLFPIHEYWTDVGRPEDLDLAEARHNDDQDDTGR
jgi:UDP-2,4-diacetamido-2,4,6-trideoxy-beta-L-gulopyranose hydrolase